MEDDEGLCLCSIVRGICLLSHTAPILAYLGGELSNEITAALPNSYVRDFLCLTLAAAPARLLQASHGP